jgi:hypothetical protein
MRPRQEHVRISRGMHKLLIISIPAYDERRYTEGSAQAP